jgi:glycosyltransferase involved in cell wall biosynthesis
MNSQSMPVTAIIPTRNEARNLPTCLAALVGFTDVIVVDSGSTDGTQEIARCAGAKVVQFEWKGGFPKKRNWMLLNYSFRTPWVLFVDADERITCEFRNEMAEKIDMGGYVGFWLNYNNHFQGRVLRHGIPQRKLALFRTDAGLFEKIEDPGWSNLDMEVHEHPILTGRVGEIRSPIDHLDFRGMYHFIQRHNEYSSWESKRYLAIKGQNLPNLTSRQIIKYRHLDKWWYPFAYFVAAYFAKLGFLDGRAGFAYAFLKCAYFLEIQEKLREAQRSGNVATR